jgi:transcriptional regulator with XRE-family HTH domain
VANNETGANEDLGVILAILRTIRGWRQIDLARAAVIDKSSISDYEQGKVSPELKSLWKMVTAMGFSMSAVEEARQLIASLRSRSLEPDAAAEDRLSARLEAISIEAAQAARAFTRNLLDTFLRELPRLARAELSACGSGPGSLPPAEESGRGAVLWAKLKTYSLKRQKALVRETREFLSWRLAELLASKSVQAAADSATLAVHLAELAVLIADRIESSDPWGLRLRGYAWAHLGNARRALGDIPSAEKAFATAERLWSEGSLAAPSFLGEVRILDLKASLRIAQRRFPEALATIDRALAADESGAAAGRLLILKAKALEELGDLEGAIVVLRTAEPWVEVANDPRLTLCLRHNLLDYLSKVGRAAEAEALLPGVEKLTRQAGGDLDLLRLRWTEARIADGLGRTEQAVEILTQVRSEFVAEGITYDAVLASLELATLYARTGRTEDVKMLARHMAPVFQLQGIHREALAALALFRKAAEREAATTELVRRVHDFLIQVQDHPELQWNYEARER